MLSDYIEKANHFWKMGEIFFGGGELVVGGWWLGEGN